MVIAMVLAVPVAFVHLPAPVEVVIVRVAPVRAPIWRPIPTSRNPVVPASIVSPVAIDPDESVSRHCRAYLIPERWRGTTDKHLNLGKGRNRKGRNCYCAE